MTERALLSLTPAESKQLIGRGVVRHGAVGRALDRGVLIIALGTTNAAVAEAVNGGALDPLRFAAGLVQAGYPCPSPAASRLAPLVLEQGERSDLRPEEALARYGADAVIVKGGNAIDVEGRVGVLLASADGGTVGSLLVRARALGAVILSPIGLEKLVPSVPAACAALGQARIGKSLGVRCGMMELTGAEAVTEIESLALIAAVGATHVASGGVAGSEGAVTLSLDGSVDQIRAAVKIVNELKGAPALQSPLKPQCAACTLNCDLAGGEEWSEETHKVSNP